MGQRWMRWTVAGSALALALASVQLARATPPASPAACDPGVSSSTLGPSWLTDMPDLLCAWNGPYNTAATGLHDHGCFDGYACDLQSRSYTFGGLTSATDGQLRYCSDCTATSPCASGGDGVIARRENGAWNCASGSAGVRHQLSWFFAGTPSAAVQPVRALAHAGGGTCLLTGAEISTNTTASTNTTWNLQRCADADCTSPTNVFTSDSTLNSGAQRYYPAPNTTTVSIGDAFRVKFVTVGTGLSDVAVALTYKCDE